MKREKWNSPIEFTFETDHGTDVEVAAEVYAEGSYDEPSLGLDGEITVDGVELSERLDLSKDDRARIEKRVDALMDKRIDEFSGEISQELYENAASDAYDRYKDLMKYGED